MLRDKRANRYLELDTQEYYSDRWMAGNSGSTAAVAQFASIDLFNDGSLGASLLLYDFTAQLSANNPVIVYPVKDHFLTAAANSLSLNPLSQQKEGSVFNGLLSALPTAGYKFFVGSNGIYQWDHEWAISEIVPGWSLRFTAGISNTVLTMGFLWLIEPAT